MQTNSLKKILLIASIGLLLASPLFSHAQTEAIQQALEKSNASLDAKCSISNIWGCIQGGAEWIGTLLGLIPAMIAGVMIGWGAELINFMIELSRNLLQLDPASPGFNILLKTGFGIMLDIANLGFVLAIIVIAFATMFRLESYAMKQTLWKLIAAALLVNFSLPLAGLIIDFTNVLAYFFINQGSGGGASFANFGTFTNNIVAAFQPQKAFVTADADVLQAGFGALLGLIITPILITIFSLITAIVILTFGFMLLVRYIWLEILLVMMPLAWLMWIFPNLSHLWSKWWKNFIKWNFFLPAATFFIYLALVSTSQIGQQINSRAGDPQIAQAVSSVTIMKDSISVFLQLMIMSGMMVGGLWAASEMGIKAADTGMAWAKGVKNTFVGAAGKVGTRLASAPLRSAWGRNVIAGMQKVPLLRFAGTGLANLRATAEKSILEPHEKALKGLSLEEMARRYTYAPAPMQMLIVQTLAKNTIKKDGVEKSALELIKKEKTTADKFIAGLEKKYGQHETKPKKKSAKELAKAILGEEGGGEKKEEKKEEEKKS